MLTLHGIFEHGVELFLRFTLAELGSDLAANSVGSKRKGDGVIGAEVQGASAL